MAIRCRRPLGDTGAIMHAMARTQNDTVAGIEPQDNLRNLPIPMANSTSVLTACPPAKRNTAQASPCRNSALKGTLRTLSDFQDVTRA